MHEVDLRGITQETSPGSSFFSGEEIHVGPITHWFYDHVTLEHIIGGLVFAIIFAFVTCIYHLSHALEKVGGCCCIVCRKCNECHMERQKNKLENRRLNIEERKIKLMEQGRTFTELEDVCLTTKAAEKASEKVSLIAPLAKISNPYVKPGGSNPPIVDQKSEKKKNKIAKNSINSTIAITMLAIVFLPLICADDQYCTEEKTVSASTLIINEDFYYAMEKIKDTEDYNQLMSPLFRKTLDVLISDEHGMKLCYALFENYRMSAATIIDYQQFMVSVLNLYDIKSYGLGFSKNITDELGYMRLPAKDLSKRKIWSDNVNFQLLQYHSYQIADNVWNAILDIFLKVDQLFGFKDIVRFLQYQLNPDIYKVQSTMMILYDPKTKKRTSEMQRCFRFFAVESATHYIECNREYKMDDFMFNAMGLIFDYIANSTQSNQTVVKIDDEEICKYNFVQFLDNNPCKHVAFFDLMHPDSIISNFDLNYEYDEISSKKNLENLTFKVILKKYDTVSYYRLPYVNFIENWQTDVGIINFIPHINNHQKIKIITKDYKERNPDCNKVLWFKRNWWYKISDVNHVYSQFMPMLDVVFKCIDKNYLNWGDTYTYLGVRNVSGKEIVYAMDLTLVKGEELDLDFYFDMVSGLLVQVKHYSNFDNFCKFQQYVEKRSIGLHIAQYRCAMMVKEVIVKQSSGVIPPDQDRVQIVTPAVKIVSGKKINHTKYVKLDEKYIQDDADDNIDWLCERVPWFECDEKLYHVFLLCLSILFCFLILFFISCIIIDFMIICGKARYIKISIATRKLFILYFIWLKFREFLYNYACFWYAILVLICLPFALAFLVLMGIIRLVLLCKRNFPLFIFPLSFFIKQIEAVSFLNFDFKTALESIPTSYELTVALPGFGWARLGVSFGFYWFIILFLFTVVNILTHWRKLPYAQIDLDYHTKSKIHRRWLQLREFLLNYYSLGYFILCLLCLPIAVVYLTLAGFCRILKLPNIGIGFLIFPLSFFSGEISAATIDTVCQALWNVKIHHGANNYSQMMSLDQYVAKGEMCLDEFETCKSTHIIKKSVSLVPCANALLRTPKYQIYFTVLSYQKFYFSDILNVFPSVKTDTIFLPLSCHLNNGIAKSNQCGSITTKLNVPGCRLNCIKYEDFAEYNMHYGRPTNEPWLTLMFEKHTFEGVLQRINTPYEAQCETTSTCVTPGMHFSSQNLRLNYVDLNREVKDFLLLLKLGKINEVGKISITGAGQQKDISLSSDINYGTIDLGSQQLVRYFWRKHLNHREQQFVLAHFEAPYKGTVATRLWVIPDTNTLKEVLTLKCGNTVPAKGLTADCISERKTIYQDTLPIGELVTVLDDRFKRIRDLMITIKDADMEIERINQKMCDRMSLLGSSYVIDCEKFELTKRQLTLEILELTFRGNYLDLSVEATEPIAQLGLNSFPAKLEITKCEGLYGVHEGVAITLKRIDKHLASATFLCKENGRPCGYHEIAQLNEELILMFSFEYKDSDIILEQIHPDFENNTYHITGCTLKYPDTTVQGGIYKYAPTFRPRESGVDFSFLDFSLYNPLTILSRYIGDIGSYIVTIIIILMVLVIVFLLLYCLCRRRLLSYTQGLPRVVNNGVAVGRKKLRQIIVRAKKFRKQK